MAPQSNGNNLVVQGRIVWNIGSNLFEGKQKTDYNTNAPVFDQAGNPKIEYGFGLAIPKTDPTTGQPTAEFTKVWEALHKEAFTLYPSGQIPPGFAMKFKDGDGIDHTGKSYADREGHAGHIILMCTTQIPIKYFLFQGGNNILVNEGIKTGDYVNVQLNIKSHPAKGQGKAGLYLNPSAVQLIQPGKEIINAPSGDQIFGQAAPSYVGQAVADTAPSMPQGMTQEAAIMQPTPAMGAPAMPAQAVPAPQAQPHYGVLPQTHQPVVPNNMGGMVQPGIAAPGSLPANPANPAQLGQVPTTPYQQVPGAVPPQAALATPNLAPAMPGIAPQTPAPGTLPAIPGMPGQ